MARWQKRKLQKPSVPIDNEPSFITSDVLKIVKSLEETKEQHGELEKKYAMLTSYLKRNGIEIPDFMLKNKQ